MSESLPGPPSPSPPSRRLLFARGSWSEDSRIAALLRQETVGGALLLVGTVLALVWANSSWSTSYAALRDYRIGPEVLHLDLTLGTWAADGLLAIFFFVVGLELKREFVAGDLKDPRRAALPILAAVGGMVIPALVFVVVNATTGAGALRGWAIPHRHRHRLRPGRAGRDQHPPACGAPHVSAHPGGGR